MMVKNFFELKLINNEKKFYKALFQTFISRLEIYNIWKAEIPFYAKKITTMQPNFVWKPEIIPDPD